MRFASRLYSLANDFRKGHFSSDDEQDFTVLPDDWRSESAEKSPAKGGNYLCGHLRRQDFVRGRPKDVPSMKIAAKQIRKSAKLLNLTHIFIASDGTDQGLV